MSSFRRRFMMLKKSESGGGGGYPADAIMTVDSNPEVLAICYAQGWCAHEEYMTASEAAAVSDIGMVFRYSSIQHFDEFKYFTGLTTIPQYAFQECGMTSIEIPNGVTSISAHAIRKCESLVSVTIPASVTNIAQYAFRDCTALATIKSLATNAPSITSTVFYRINTGGVLQVPSGASGYDVWMGTGNYYLGLYGWTKQEF